MKTTAFLLVSAIVISACGGSATLEAGGASPESSTTLAPTTTLASAEESPTPEIMSVAFETLVAENNTFGNGPPPFTEYLVQSRLDPNAGDPTAFSAAPGRALTGSERTAIAATLAQFGPVRWIDDPADWRTDDLRPTIEGAAILGIGEPSINDDMASVPMSLWCGGLCGTWFTYGAKLADGTWSITGIEGPVAIS